MIYQFPARFALILCCAFGLVSAYQGLAQGDNNRVLLSQSRPDPPPRLPPNRTRPGGGLNPAKQACIANEQALTAIVPEENPVVSVSPHPTFLFYIPDAADDIASVEFSLFTSDEKQRLFSTRFTPEQVPGIITIRIPEEPEYALDVQQVYRWYFKVYCAGDTNSDAAVLTVDGWVSPVDATAERQTQIEAVSPEVWYDSLALVVDHLQNSPNDPTWRQHWVTLLESIGLENLAEANFADTVSNMSDERTETETETETEF